MHDKNVQKKIELKIQNPRMNRKQENNILKKLKFSPLLSHKKHNDILSNLINFSQPATENHRARN